MSKKGILGVSAIAILLAGVSGCESSKAPGTGTPGKVAIGPEGGEVSFGRVVLKVPAGALDEDVLFSIHPSLFAPAEHLDHAYEIGPDGTVFAKPARLEWSYDGIALPERVRETDLILARLDQASGQDWDLLWNRTVDEERHVVETEIEHLSCYALAFRIPPGGRDAMDCEFTCEPGDTDSDLPEQASTPDEEPLCPVTGVWETCRKGGAKDPPDLEFDFDYQICMDKCTGKVPSNCGIEDCATFPSKCIELCKNFCDSYEKIADCFNHMFDDATITLEIDEHCNVHVTDSYLYDCEKPENSYDFEKAILNEQEGTWKPTIGPIGAPIEDPGECWAANIQRFPYYADDSGRILALGYEFIMDSPFEQCEACLALDGYWPGRFAVRYLMEKKEGLGAGPPVLYGAESLPGPPDEPVSVFIASIRDSSLSDDDFDKLPPKAQNNVVFRDGVAEFEARAMLFKSGEPIDDPLLEKDIKWTLEPTGKMNVEFDPADGSGKGVGKKVKVTINGLPESIRDFSAMSIRATIPCGTKCTQCSTDTQKLDLFFLRDGRDHPGGDSTPNWFYYWKQLLDPGVASVLYYDPDCAKAGPGGKVKVRGGFFHPPRKDCPNAHVHICDFAKMWSDVAGGYEKGGCSPDAGEFQYVPGTTSPTPCETGHEFTVMDGKKKKKVTGVYHFVDAAYHEYQHYLNWKKLQDFFATASDLECFDDCKKVGPGLYSGCESCKYGDCDGDCLVMTDDKDDYDQNVDKDRWSDEHETAYAAGAKALQQLKAELDKLDMSFTWEAPGICGGKGVTQTDILVKHRDECQSKGWPNGKVQVKEEDFRDPPYGGP